MRSLVLANQKGGVGKTTTAIHLAHGLALSGFEVALFDLDPQGNATVALQGMFASDGEDGQLIQVCEGLRLLPSPGAKAVMEHQLSVDPAKLAELARSLTPAIDWLLVDCPPRLDAWGWAGLQLCEQVLVPVQAEFFSMHGLSQMIAALETAGLHYPGKANLLGVVPTMVDTREPLALEVIEDLRRNLGNKVTETVVLRDTMLVEAASHGKTAFEHCPDSVGALCYTELVKEILDGGA
ncbi:MAG: ParA family protein [Planctomycetes bacterium]|nr:ParA family protein [Planctomycetota bacterium]